MSLEDKIKMILEGQKADKLADPKDDDDEDKEDKESNSDDSNVDGNGDQDKDQDKDQDDTDVSKDTKKEKAEVKESATNVPGSPDLLGKKQSEELKSKAEEISGATKTSKMTSGYNKGTKQPKVEDVTKGGSTDEKATAETAKIKAAYKSTTMPKLKAEAFEAMFSGEALTEEFKVKAEAIFEAAVEQVSQAKIAALEEEYQEQLLVAIDEVKGELVEQIDGYLEEVIEKWMQDNAVALESGIKVEMVSSFMDKMKDVFVEHYIDVPESKIDVVEEQAKQIEEMKTELAEAKELVEQTIAEKTILACNAIIAEHSDGLTAMEAEKLQSLAENVEFDTEEEFDIKVKSLKESYFRKGKVEFAQESTIAKTTVNETHSDVAAVLKVLNNTKDSTLKIIRSSN